MKFLLLSSILCFSLVNVLAKLNEDQIKIVCNIKDAPKVCPEAGKFDPVCVDIATQINGINPSCYDKGICAVVPMPAEKSTTPSPNVPGGAPEAAPLAAGETTTTPKSAAGPLNRRDVPAATPAPGTDKIMKILPNTVFIATVKSIDEYAIQKTCDNGVSVFRHNKKSGPAGNSPAGVTPAGNAPAGVTPAGLAPEGNPPAGNAPAGITPAGNAPAGNAPAGNAPAGVTPAGNAPAGVAPAGVTPGAL